MTETLQRIRDIFNESGDSQTKIANKIGKTPQYIWKLLKNDEANPSNSVINDICRVYNINEEWVLNGTEPKYKNSGLDEYSEISTIIGETDEKAKKAIIDYWKLSDEDKELFWNFVNRFFKKED